MRPGSTRITGTTGAAISPMNRYPRRGNVSIHFGFSAESLNASRSFFTAVFSPCSKSTNVSVGHNAAFNSSRVTISGALSSNIFNTIDDCPPSRIGLPRLSNSCVCKSASNGPNRFIRPPFSVFCDISLTFVAPRVTQLGPSKPLAVNGLGERGSVYEKCMRNRFDIH